MARELLVAHSEALVAEGIAVALSRYPGIRAVGIATSLDECSRYVGRVAAAAVDHSMPQAELAARRFRRSGVRVVFLGGSAAEDEGVRVSTGDSIAMLAKALVPSTPDAGTRPVLARREREILTLVADGLTGKQVARRLGISPKTVEHHKTRIFSKLGVPNQTAAVKYVLSLQPAGLSA